MKNNQHLYLDTQKTLLIHTLHFPSLANLFHLNNETQFLAGPCSVESLEQMEVIARFLQSKGMRFIRAGAYKPRTSPYSFQGLGEEGLQIIKHVSSKYSLFSISEIMDARDIELFLKHIDILQVGSRNMQNTTLLKEIGKTNHPVLLKRGMMSTLKEFLLAAEYIVAGGNKNLILCERGIRTFEESTRNTLDISTIAIIKNETSLPVIVDLSHSLGRKDILLPVSKAVQALNVDGIMLEVHNEPAKALSDARYQLSLEEFAALLCAFQDSERTH